MAPRILVCDDAPGYRLLVQTIFEDAGLEVAGTAGTWEESERLAAALRPDAILLDLWLPTFDPDGVRRVRAAAPGSVLAVVSALAADEVAALVDGIDGVDLVLSKRQPPDALAAAVRARLRS
ncbi:MAG: response regulator [Solirubrobacteraceae bacterium]|nr:response regulator [Solirubrobacteraceae bacterium]